MHRSEVGFSAVEWVRRQSRKPAASAHDDSVMDPAPRGAGLEILTAAEGRGVVDNDSACSSAFVVRWKRSTTCSFSECGGGKYRRRFGVLPDGVDHQHIAFVWPTDPRTGRFRVSLCGRSDGCGAPDDPLPYHHYFLGRLNDVDRLRLIEIVGRTPVGQQRASRENTALPRSTRRWSFQTLFGEVGQVGLSRSAN